jgi:hypothetical protein
VKGASGLVLEQDLELVARAIEGAMEMKKKEFNGSITVKIVV